jgi:putative adhesin
MRPNIDFRLIFGSILILVGLSAAPASPRHHSVSNADDHWRHSMNISGGHKQPANDCSDLRIRFDDEDAVVRSETRTLSKAEAPVLKVHPHMNGGTQVVGWDNANYSVTACKAVAPGNDAESMLSQIGMTIENGTVSTHGPSGDHDWTVYLLIRAPKSAAMELETMNGPISLYDVNGKLTAHANNGPISLHNVSGDADITAQNGPISMEGSSGNIRIKTQNGPISVNLDGTSWNGAGLSADAQNGPVTLRVPSGFQSGFVVESTNHAPMSCHASICGSARKTWDDEHRRIEYGSSPAVVHLSTVNGPVSVEDGRD